MGFEGWEGCGALPVLLAPTPAPIDPTLSWPAGHSPPSCFLGHPAQLSGTRQTKKGVLGGRYYVRKYIGVSGRAAIGGGDFGVFRSKTGGGVAAEELSGRE